MGWGEIVGLALACLSAGMLIGTTWHQRAITRRAASARNHNLIDLYHQKGLNLDEDA